ncbi:hypothetical protein, partial [Pseudomonas aeruginosa]|uniref:hypothetical protein n=1 Tax=Pseudomonas aeruginosa TaxID=287 RepID=UPI00211912AB
AGEHQEGTAAQHAVLLVDGPLAAHAIRMARRMYAGCRAEPMLGWRPREQQPTVGVGSTESSLAHAPCDGAAGGNRGGQRHHR